MLSSSRLATEWGGATFIIFFVGATQVDDDHKLCSVCWTSGTKVIDELLEHALTGARKSIKECGRRIC